MFPSLNRPLVNFPHSGFVKNWSWEDERKPTRFLYGMFVPESSRKGGPQDGPWFAGNRPIFIH
jgi:hypothetical protein